MCVLSLSSCIEAEAFFIAVRKMWEQAMKEREGEVFVILFRRKKLLRLPVYIQKTLSIITQKPKVIPGFIKKKIMCFIEIYVQYGTRNMWSLKKWEMTLVAKVKNTVPYEWTWYVYIRYTGKYDTVYKYIKYCKTGTGMFGNVPHQMTYAYSLYPYSIPIPVHTVSYLYLWIQYG